MSRPAPRLPGRVQRVAAFGYGGLGDLILFFPALVGVRRAFPAARITLYCRPNNPGAELAAAMGIVDELIASWPAAVDAWTGLTGPRHDLAVAEHHFPSVYLAPVVMRSRCAAGVVSGGGYSFEFDFLFGAQVPCREGEHAIERSFRLLDALGIPRPEWPPSEAKRLRGETHARDSQPTVVLHPLCWDGQAWKRWPLGRFVQLAERLDARIVVIGSTEEGPPLREAFGGDVTILAGAPILEIAGVLSNASAVVGNDSGIEHLAALVGAPVVSLYGPTDEALTAPRGERVTVVTAQCDRRPCYRFGRSEIDPDCRGETCMDTIAVERVAETVEAIRK